MGDQIATATGNPATITTIESLDGTREVFNLTVAEDASYAVGELGVWAHNGFGAYVVFGPNDVYVGKGDFSRARKSARKRGGCGIFHVTRKKSNRDSFVLEDEIIEFLEGRGVKLTNKIASPGKKIRKR